jgi:hypothetical protein
MMSQTKQISTYYNGDGTRGAIVKLVDETFMVDFYVNNVYYHTIEYPNKSINYVEDAAENYIHGIFHNIKDYDVVRD